VKFAGVMLSLFCAGAANVQKPTNYTTVAGDFSSVLESTASGILRLHFY